MPLATCIAAAANTGTLQGYRSMLDTEEPPKLAPLHVAFCAKTSPPPIQEPLPRCDLDKLPSRSSTEDSLGTYKNAAYGIKNRSC
jgi:hypothetical protein